MKKLLYATLMIVLTAVLGLGCSSSESDTADNEAVQTAATAQTMSDQPVGSAVNHPGLYVSAVDLDGQSRRLAEWVGQKPVVINFWGTWCPPCRREIPGLVRLYDEYRDSGVEIVSLAIEKRAGPDQVRQFTEQAGMQWTQLMANDNVLKAFGYDGAVPLTVFLDKDGREVARHRGGRPYEVFKPDFKRIAKGI